MREEVKHRKVGLHNRVQALANFTSDCACWNTKLSIPLDQEAENWKHLHQEKSKAIGTHCLKVMLRVLPQNTPEARPAGSRLATSSSRKQLVCPPVSIGKMTRWRIAFPPRGAGVDIENDDENCDELEVQMQSEKKECMVPTSSSSANVLLNIQSAMSGLLPMPSSRAASSTDARRALDSLGAVFEVEDVVDDFEPLLGLCKGAGRGTGACGRGKVKVLSIMFGGLPM